MLILEYEVSCCTRVTNQLTNPVKICYNNVSGVGFEILRVTVSHGTCTVNVKIVGILDARASSKIDICVSKQDIYFVCTSAIRHLKERDNERNQP